MGVLSIFNVINEYSGVIGLALSAVVLPILTSLNSTYKDNKAASNILGGLTRGAELGADLLVNGKVPTKAEAIIKTIEYARKSYPDAFARVQLDPAHLVEMAQAQLEPVLRATVQAEAAKVGLDSLLPPALQPAQGPVGTPGAAVGGGE